MDGARLRVRDTAASPRKRSRSTSRRSRPIPTTGLHRAAGYVLVRLGRFKEAQQEVESLVESAPRDPRIWIKLGAIYYEQKQWDRAVSAFQQRRCASSPPMSGRGISSPRRSWIRATGRGGADGAPDDPGRRSPRRSTPASSSAFLYGRASATTRPSRSCRKPSTSSPSGPSLRVPGHRATSGRQQYDRAARGAPGRVESRRRQQGPRVPAPAWSTRSRALRRRHHGLPARARARPQARRVVQLHRLHVRRARPRT